MQRAMADSEKRAKRERHSSARWRIPRRELSESDMY